jgi:hypothetical protein
MRAEFVNNTLLNKKKLLHLTDHAVLERELLSS